MRVLAPSSEDPWRLHDVVCHLLKSFVKQAEFEPLRRFLVIKLFFLLFLLRPRFSGFRLGDKMVLDIIKVEIFK